MIRFTEVTCSMGLNGTDIHEDDIRRFLETIREKSMYDFSDYSIKSLHRRLLKITEDYGADMDRLIGIVGNDPVALEEVVKKITVRTTELFRDPQVWTSLMLNLMPRFRDHSLIRIWHPGSSTGQEVYSMMILLDQLGLLDRSEIYASDINEDVLKVAREGRYRLRFNRVYLENYDAVFSMDNSKLTGIRFAPREKYFSVDESIDTILLNDRLRDKPVYKKIDLVRERDLFRIPFDVIVCRNVIIYFNHDLQNRVLRMFHRNMRISGALVLGMHESIIGAGTALFRKEDYFYIRKKSVRDYEHAKESQ